MQTDSTSSSTSKRTRLLASVCTPLLLLFASFAIPSGRAHAVRYERWVFANQPTTASYSVTSNAFTKGNATITRITTGYYEVRFPGLATWTSTTSDYRGIALAVAIGNDNVRCGTEDWTRSGTDVVVKVSCVNASAPVLTDSQMLVRFTLSVGEAFGAYATVTHPSRPVNTWDYAQPRSFNSKDATTNAVSVKRLGTGDYVFHFNGDQRRPHAYISNVTVSPPVAVASGLSNTGIHCNSYGTVFLSTYAEVFVQCWDPYGGPANTNAAVFLDDRGLFGSQSGGRITSAGAVSSSYGYFGSVVGVGQIDMVAPRHLTPSATTPAWSFPTAGHLGASHFCKFQGLGNANLNVCSGTSNHGLFEDINCFTTTGAPVTPNTVSVTTTASLAWQCY